MIAVVTWSHTSCSDVWPVYFGQMEKFYDSSHYVLLNEYSDKLSKKYTQIINNEEDPFYKRILHSLDKVKEEYIILSLEDFILYSSPKVDEIGHIKKIMVDKDLTCTRLCKSGAMGGYPVENNLFLIPSSDQYVCSWQPAIWNLQDLKKLIKYFRPKTFRCFEAFGSLAMSSLNMRTYYYYNHTKKRGSMHFDSDLYPYMPAIRAGKWCIDDYPLIMPKILKEYKININNRGTYKNEK